MYFDENDHDVLLALNGELVGMVKEADTTEGYIIQHGHECRGDKIVVTGSDLRQTGRVDFIGDRVKDSPRVIYGRLNKVRAELGLELYDPPIFDD